MSINQYENFRVASVLCPPALRPALDAIYRLARTADGLVDEGNAAYHAELRATASGRRPATQRQHIFTPLRHGLDHVQGVQQLRHSDKLREARP